MEHYRKRLLGSYLLFLLSVCFLDLVAPAPAPAPQMLEMPGCNSGTALPEIAFPPTILNVNVERVLFNTPNGMPDLSGIEQQKECCRGVEDEGKVLGKILNLQPGEDLFGLGAVAAVGAEILRPDEKIIEGKKEDMAECCRGVAEEGHHH